MTPRTFWKQAWWVFTKDMRVEFRAGVTLRMAIPFAALALLLAPLAIGTDTALLRRIGPGMLWLVAILFGMTVTVRSGAQEPGPVRDLLTLSGLDPAAGFLGRSLAGAVLLFGLTLVLAPLMIVLYAPEGSPRWGWLALLAVAGVMALGLLRSLVSSLVTGLRARTALGPLLAIPPAVPILLATARGTDSAISRQGSLSWLLLLVAMNLALVIVGVLLAGPLDDTTR